MSIRVAILGYGNLGRGMECAVKQNDDMELVAVFTRRDPATVKTLTDVKVYNVDQLLSMQDQIDVLVLCGGSATDLPKQTAEYAKYFNVVDSFDTHAKIPEHFAQVDTAAKEGGKVAMISVGWDPGMFSLNLKGMPRCDGTCLNYFSKNPDRGSGLVSWACAAFSPV